MTTQPRILIVEDDHGVVKGLVAGLRKAGFQTSVAMTGEEGLARILKERFDLVLLDLMLPERSGFEIIEAMRNRVSVPVIVLTARTDLPSRLRCFDGGAIDFVPKPFFLEEVVARIHSRLTLGGNEARREFVFGEVVVDLDARTAFRGDTDLGLTGYELNILGLLLERAGRAQTRAQIAEYALSEDGDCNDRTVDSHISRIRRKLGPEGGLVRTVWGIGYRFDLEPS